MIFYSWLLALRKRGGLRPQPPYMFWLCLLVYMSFSFTCGSSCTLPPFVVFSFPLAQKIIWICLGLGGNKPCRINKDVSPPLHLLFRKSEHTNASTESDFTKSPKSQSCLESQVFSLFIWPLSCNIERSLENYFELFFGSAKTCHGTLSPPKEAVHENPFSRAAVFLLTVGSVLLTVEFFYLQLCLGDFLLTALASVLTVVAFLLTVGNCVE